MADANVQRLARRSASSGTTAGPSTHDELGYAFEDAGLDHFDAELMRSYEGSKRDRVNRAVRLAAEHGRLWPLVERLVSSLHDAGMFDDEQSPDHQQRAARLRRALAGTGRGISSDGTLTGSISPAVAEAPYRPSIGRAPARGQP
jgi:hypothetical protein